MLSNSWPTPARWVTAKASGSNSSIGVTPVNLRGWTLADLGTDRFTVATDLTIAPGAYISWRAMGMPGQRRRGPGADVHRHQLGQR
ncbi:MAG: hypothetical protein R2838_05925 [Caldilineaceae bacterium]